jgi:hypothetical protein
MMERSELRISHLMNKLNDQAKMREELRLQVINKELELKLKLADMFKDDKEGYINALNLTFAPDVAILQPNVPEPVVQIHQTSATRSRL